QVYDQELLEFMAQYTVARQGLLDNLSPPCARWIEARLGELKRLYGFGEGDNLLQLARLVLALAAQGEVVLVGRGAGCLLPRATTVTIRSVAPRQQRIAYMSQWLRLSLAEAAEKVRGRDERRAAFLTTNFNCPPGDVQQYDLVLNTSHLGEEACAELITQAAR